MNKIKDFLKKIPLKTYFLSGISLLLLIILVLIGYFYWNRVILKVETKLKIGVVTDWEYGYKTKVGNKLTDSAPAELEKVVQYFNEDFQPEIVIECGDMVESSLSKKKTTLKQFEKINAIFSKLTASRGYAFGNHDLRDLNKEELRNILGINYNHTYFDMGDWRLIVMDTNFKTDGSDFNSGYYMEGYIPESEFDWLREAFQTKKPVILFSHHSPVPVNLNGVLAESNKNLFNAMDGHNFLKQFNNLVLVVSGHDPRFSFGNFDGINYLIVDNLANTDSIGSFASLETKYNKYTKEARVNIEHHGPTYKNFAIGKKIGEANWKDLVWKK